MEAEILTSIGGGRVARITFDQAQEVFMVKWLISHGVTVMVKQYDGGITFRPGDEDKVNAYYRRF